MEPYIFTKHNVEGKSIAEGCLFHPQIAGVTWTEGALEAAWNVNHTHSSISVGEATLNTYLTQKW